MLEGMLSQGMFSEEVVDEKKGIEMCFVHLVMNESSSRRVYPVELNILTGERE